MRVINFNEATNTLSIVADTLDDLYLLARIISPGDKVEAKSYRRYRPSESDEGEQKEVVVEISVEKIELDKNAERLRLTGKITRGKPEQYVAIGSYHTLNLQTGERIAIAKQEWPDYLRAMIRDAVEASKRPRLGVVAIDDEKAVFAYVKGYGISIAAEIYSKLSKKMKQSEYEKEKAKFLQQVAQKIKDMKVDTVVVAGPGFTKEDLKAYMQASRLELGKKLFWVNASDTEISGIKEALWSEELGKFLEKEKVKEEFDYINLFLKGLTFGASFSGVEKVRQAIESYQAGVVLVNDSVINEEDIKQVLKEAYVNKVPIKIFNSEDDAGMQLKSFGNIAAIGKQLVAQNN
jgi:protein pelota